jgi:signal transduction histidine kinase
MQQLFFNLIDNALKFYYQTPLRVEIFAVEQDNFWEFHARDDGIGIEAEYHTRIFDMFTQLHRKEQYEGSGMRLAICQEIVHKHLGTICVQSIFGCGSEFIVTFSKE